MKYKYYTQTESDTHYLHIGEIAKLFTKATGLTDANGKPPYGRLRTILDMIEMEHGEKPLYSNTRNGVKRVYRHPQEAIQTLFHNMMSERASEQEIAV